jgi:uncharacterized protein YoaH (UPF0181 family)
MTRTERTHQLRMEAKELLSQILTSPQPAKWAENLAAFVEVCYVTGRADALVAENVRAAQRNEKRQRALAEDTMEIKRWRPEYEPQEVA